ncbi:HCLS1-associated protein X-1 [Spea bombifrons]|uniref:HCLS1-associated protein X-1 n=1 Tax=Spea bombifrons TaxID=233779 RepID=UPI0023493E77|nr:HCLS1-associated protein X-1 [Spea bombifrons]
MSLFDLFRRFFEPGGRRDPFFGGMTLDEDDEDDDDDDDEENSGYPFGRPPAFDFGFSFGQSPFHRMFGLDEFFRDFDELFTDLGSINRQIPELPGIDPPPQRRDRGASTLRDFMLKSPDSHLPRGRDLYSRDPTSPEGPRQPRIPWQEDEAIRIPQGDPRQDRDLDSEVSSKGLDAILTPAEPRAPSFFQSVSVSRVTRPDGTIEERRTVRDGRGNATTTVTVRRGDQIISSSTEDPTHGTITGVQPDASRGPPQDPLDLSDSQTILRRILQRWFSQ